MLIRVSAADNIESDPQMANGEGAVEKRGDFYAILGLKKKCSDAELRIAYKKLAMKWHPDRCSASGNSKFVEEAKAKFQEIQEAYSVLSDSNKRLLYDVGVYDSDDDENQGMGDFLGEMAQMMSQTKPNEGGHESFEELQQLFVELFQSDLDCGFAGPTASYNNTDVRDRFSPSASASSSSSTASCNGSFGGSKRGNSAMDPVRIGAADLDSASGGFCFGSNESGKESKGRGGGTGSSIGSSSKRRTGRKQKVSSKHDVSSRDAEISAA